MLFFRMPNVDHSAAACEIGHDDPSADLAELWRGTLARADPKNLRVTVRPSDHADSSTRQTGTRFPSSENPAAPSGNVTPDAPMMPGQQGPGLEDADGLSTSRDRFFLGALLGRGGTSVVVEAVQRTLVRTVAVKIARYDLDRGQRERFRTEAKCTAWLEHPNIVPVYEAGRNYLVMRRIVGSDLEQDLLAGRLDLAGAVEVLLKVCDAVSFAHHRGIIHRDIKPENILVGRFGEAMLADWGLALTCTAAPDGVLRAPLIGSGRALCGGTPGYMAPEVALADRASIGYATDVFLLGATLYRCLSGDIPFSGADVWQAIERSATNDWQRLGDRIPQLPSRLVSLQERAMASNPRERPSVGEFQAGLREWLLRSRAESAALGELAAARRHLQSAQSHRLHPHEAYLDFSEAIAACDRAHALNPDLGEVNELRETACGDFTLAAVGAGEPQLARLIKRSGRLSVLASLPDRPAAAAPPQSGDGSTVRRIAKLLPEASRQSGELAGLLHERLQLRQECTRLGHEIATLNGEVARLGSARDTLVGRCSEQQCHARLRRRARLATIVAGGLALLALLALLRWASG